MPKAKIRASEVYRRAAEFALLHGSGFAYLSSYPDLYNRYSDMIGWSIDSRNEYCLRLLLMSAIAAEEEKETK